jgi:hypothetical protein
MIKLSENFDQLERKVQSFAVVANPMSQRLGLIVEQEHDVARLGLRLAQLEPQTDTMIDGVGILFQRVQRPAPAPFLGSTLESCEGRPTAPYVVDG